MTTNGAMQPTLAERLHAARTARAIADGDASDDAIIDRDGVIDLRNDRAGTGGPLLEDGQTPASMPSPVMAEIRMPEPVNVDTLYLREDDTPTRWWQRLR